MQADVRRNRSLSNDSGGYKMKLDEKGLFVFDAIFGFEPRFLL